MNLIALSFVLSALAPMPDSLVVPALNSNQSCLAGFDCAPKLTKSTREKFLGPTNLLVSAALVSTGLWDVKTTRDGLNLSGTYVRGNQTLVVAVHEQSWFYAGLKPEKGSNLFVIGKGGVLASTMVGSHFLRRSPHKGLRVLGWALPVATVFLQSFHALDNQRQVDAIHALR